MIMIIMIIFCIVIIWYTYIKSLFYWRIRNVLGPNPLPIFGNLKRGILRQTHSATVYKEIYDSFPNCKAVGITRMLEPALIIRDLDYIKHILIKDFEMFPERGVSFSKEGLGDNLFHTDRQTWGYLKSKISAHFTVKKLKEILPVVTNEIDKLVTNIIKVNNNNKDQEIYEMFRRFTMKTTMAAFFNIDISEKTNNNLLRELDESIFKLTINEYLDKFIPGILMNTNSSIFGEAAVHFCNKVIEHAFKNQSKGLETSNFINMLLELKENGHLKSEKNIEEDEIFNLQVTNDLLASQMFIVFGPGYENTAIVLSNAFYYLATNVDVQNRLIQEIDDITSKGEVSYEIISKMTYADMVFKETLRINPQTIILQRKALVDYTFPESNFKIEKGMIVLISPLAIHRDEKHYPNPDRFDPERFSIENSKNRHACAYLPFGVGPRSCLGYRFSMMVFKMVVVKILSKFTVRTTKRSSTEFDPYRFLLVRKGGIHLQFISRNR